MGDTLGQRWAEVAHVPLLVKDPGQRQSAIVTGPRSTGQIAQTVLNAVGATASPDLALSPDLSNDLDHGPVFTTIAGGVMTPWVYAGAAEQDPWTATDLSPPDTEHPFAIGIDLALLGAPVPTGWAQIQEVSVNALAGDSVQQLLVVDRSASSAGAAGCNVGDAAGLVSSAGTVIGSVLWEAQGSSAPLRGWAIVPRSKSGDYQFWCRAA